MGCVKSKSTAGVITPQHIKNNQTAPKPTHQQPVSTVEAQKQTPVVDRDKHLRISANDMIGKRNAYFYQEYVYVRELGRGTFGEVVEAIHKKSKQPRAIKMIQNKDMTLDEKKEMIQEIEILKKLDHPNIMRIYEYYEADDTMFIVGELYSGGELFEKIIDLKQFTEKDAAIVMKQILSAVNYCHKKGIVHRDLKPQNILYDTPSPNASIKIVDFGVSAVIEPNKNLNRATGTPLFMAPEVLKKNYNQKCDIWSCGVILYILLSGQLPFKGKTKQQILDQISRGQYDFEGEEWVLVSEKAKAFIRKLLTYDYNLRYSAEQALQDPWITTTIAEKKDVVVTLAALNNLRTYRAEKKLQEAFWTFFSSYFTRKEEKNEFLKAFQALDTNHDGTLTKDELLKGFKEVARFGYKEEDIDLIIKTADTNGNGVIDYSEFVTATMNRQSILEKGRLEDAFKMFDKDGNGEISVEEIKELLNPGGKKILDAEWIKLVKEIDQNGDQKISYTEFKDMIMKIVQG